MVDDPKCFVSVNKVNGVNFDSQRNIYYKTYNDF